jgi:Histidine phosphatase superfamily (branch 1)
MNTGTADANQPLVNLWHAVRPAMLAHSGRRCSERGCSIRRMVTVRVLTTLLLVRHGETDWNRDHRWQGHTGPPLNETGRREASELAGRISNVDAVYSSDTERAFETALILAARVGLDVQTDARLREVNFGFMGRSHTGADQRALR